MIQKYLRVARNPKDKEMHLGGVAGLLATPQWEAILQVKANIYALKKIAGLNGLADVVARRRIKHS